MSDALRGTSPLQHLDEVLSEAGKRGVLEAEIAYRVQLAARLSSPSSDPVFEPALKLDFWPCSQFALQPGPVLSDASLSRELGLSRAEVRQHVENLRALGFDIVSVTGAGYRLARPATDLLVAEAVLPHLLAKIEPGFSWLAGLPYRYLNACESTNQVLKRQADSLPPGAVVVTNRQTGGRGRLGRTWFSQPAKDLTFSVLVSPKLAPTQVQLLSLAAALAVSEVLETIPGLEGRIGIKWPNDVLLDGRKVAGILLESSMDGDRLRWAVAGIGLNVNSDPAALLEDISGRDVGEWRGKPAPVSLSAGIGREVPRAPLLAALLAQLTERWTEIEPAGLLGELRRRDVLAGRLVNVLSGPPQNDPVATGEVIGFGQEGQLLIRSTSGNVIAVFAGDVVVDQVDSCVNRPLDCLDE